MSVRQGLLALLEEAPRYGCQLRAEFEARTGATWPLNVGQLYTTLARLERDGLVEPAGTSDDEGHVYYRITEAGREAVRAWFASPVERSSPPRDELAIKLALAVTVPGVDVPAVVQRQRTATLRALQDYTRLKARALDDAGEADLAWLLVVDSLIFIAEAEVRWLDTCEARLARAAVRGAAPAPAPGAGGAVVTADTRAPAAPDAPVLELRSVTRVHGTGDAAVRALRDVSLAVRPGEAPRREGGVALPPDGTG